MSDSVISLGCGAWCVECPNKRCGYKYTREETRISHCPKCNTYRGCMEMDCKVHCGANCKNCVACEYKYGKDSPLEKCPKCGRSRKCPNPKVTNRNTCRMHGGTAKRGPASHKWKGKGIYSKAMPRAVQKNFEQIITDPTLLVMRREIALLSHRSEELLARIYDQDDEDGPKASAERWRAVQKTWREYQRAISMDDAEAVNSYREELTSLIAGGTADYDAWEEIERISERIRKLKASESKRLVEQHQIYTAEQMMAYMAAAADAVLEGMIEFQKQLAAIVTDQGILDDIARKQIGAIAERLDRISTLRDEPTTESGQQPPDSPVRGLLTTSISN